MVVVLEREVDPIEGGNANDYDYPSDPVNMYDLDGRAGQGPCTIPHAQAKVGQRYTCGGKTYTKKAPPKLRIGPVVRLLKPIVKAGAGCWAGYKIGRVVGTGAGAAATPFVGPGAIPVGTALGSAGGCTIGAAWAVWGPPGFNPIKGS